MNMLTTVSLVDNLNRQIDRKIYRLSEIELMISKLKHEQHMLSIELDHDCDLLKAAINDSEYKENIVDDVIEKHNALINGCKSIIQSLRKDNKV